MELLQQLLMAISLIVGGLAIALAKGLK